MPQAKTLPFSLAIPAHWAPADSTLPSSARAALPLQTSVLSRDVARKQFQKPLPKGDFPLCFHLRSFKTSMPRKPATLAV